MSPGHDARRGGATLPCLGAVIAGGTSSRMGTTKAEIDVGGVTLGLRAIRTLRRVADEVIQVGGAPIEGGGIEVIPDRRPGLGPAAGIETALHRADGPVVILAVDLPRVSAALLTECLRAVHAGAAAAAPRTDRWHPLCAAYGLAALEPLSARLDAEDLSLQELLDATSAVAINAPPGSLRNVNRPQDLEAIRRRS